MQRRQWIGVIIIWGAIVSGCGSSEPNLTAEQLAQQYPEKKYVQVNGVSLHLEQGGLGRPLVLLHGLLASTYIWRNITPGLTYGSTIYNLDLMGFGLSEKPQNVTYSLDTYVGQLNQFLNDFHLENPILVGHDIGGLIAALYTVRNPGKVRKLVLVNTPIYEATFPASVRLLRIPVLGEWFTGDWFLKRILRGGVLEETSMPDLLVKDYLKPYHEDPGARTALLKFVRELDLRPALENEIRPNLANLQLPVLLLWGGQSAYVPVTVGAKIEQDVPGALFTTIPRTSHYLQEERPEKIREAIQQFIRKQPAPK